MKKTILFLALILSTVSLVRAQVPDLEEVPLCGTYIFKKNLYVGSKTDQTKRLVLEHTGNEANIDFAPDLYFRAGTRRTLKLDSNADFHVYNNQQMQANKSLIFGSGTDLNASFRLKYTGNSYVEYSGHLVFRNSISTNTAVMFQRESNYTKIAIGNISTTSQNRLTLSYFEGANDAYISNTAGPIYIIPKRTDIHNGSPVACFDANGLTVRGRIVTSATA
ncbi:MAG: hypothetical protein LIO93_02235 [Bacteroidales bacterium]|nr:hypothetical protein [Bacteroidales bacterium]